MTRWPAHRGSLTLLLAALGAVGCWIDADSIAQKVDDLPPIDTDTDTDTDEPLDPLVIHSIDPAIGSNAGGDRVTIAAGPLDPDDVQVSFGGVPAEVIEVDVDQVVVASPAVSLQGAVDVVVDSADRQDRRGGGYYYWGSGEGRAGLLGLIQNYNLARPYVSQPHQRHGASLVWTEPVDLHWWQLYTDAIDTCSRDFVRSGPSVSILSTGAGELELDNGDQIFTLTVDGDGEGFSMPLQGGTFPHSRPFDLQQPAGGPGWGEIHLPGVVELPEPGFRVTDPRMEDARPTLDPRASITLRWTGGSPGDLVLVRILRYTSEVSGSGTLVDDITCALSDDGHHVVDSRVWSGWDALGFVDIYVGRVHERAVRIPHNDAESRIYGVQWWYGEAVQGF